MSRGQRWAAVRRTRKIRFIEPGSRPGRPFNAWATRWPLLGPITLASLLDERGYQVAVYNENISGPLLENPAAFEDVCSADVVGVSIMTPTAARGYALADRIRAEGSRATIVAGGVHATFRPAEARQHVDVVVRGEGESVIEDIAAGRVTGGIIKGERVEQLDLLPTLRHELMPVMTSRGCPFGCGFCTVTRMFGNRVRRQSPEKIERDIAEHVRRGFRRFFFYDDNFVTDPLHAQRLLSRLEPYNIRFHAQVRADLPWTDEGRGPRAGGLTAALRRAGGELLYIGFETLDGHTASEWGKGYSGDGSLESRLRDCVHILHDTGFWVHGMFVLGPQHTSATADDIVRFARRCGIETFQISVLTPFPGTPLLAQMRPHLVFNRFPGDWDYFDGTHCVFDHGRMSIREFQRVVLEAHRRFYAWGGFSLSRLRRVLRQGAGIFEGLSRLWVGARTARQTMDAWRDETRAFLAAARERFAAANKRERCPT
jgi:anaerobic magnesium-protoporphyrin IX monomethyl ester cyclase